METIGNLYPAARALHAWITAITAFGQATEKLRPEHEKKAALDKAIERLQVAASKRQQQLEEATAGLDGMQA